MEIEKIALKRYMEKFNNFDCNFYKNKYPDLRHLSNYKLKKHWKKHGFYENREFNYNFKKDYEIILIEEVHKFIVKMKDKNYNTAFNLFFYILFLKKLTKFNSHYYYYNYKDLHKRYNKNNCINHWISHGILEGRVCSEKYKKLSNNLKKFVNKQFDYYNYNLDKLKLINSMDLNEIKNINETIFNNKLLILELHNEIKIENKKLIFEKLKNNNLKIKHLL